MKTTTVIATTVLIAVCLTGAPTSAQTSMHDVQWIEQDQNGNNVPGAVVPGAAAAVVRDAEGLSVVIHTRHLQPGPVTVWLFFFVCSPVCSAVPTNGGPMFATADVVANNGKGTFAVGVPPDSPFLTDPLTDEVHAVVVDGKPEGTPMWQQLRSPSGGTFRQVVIAPAS